MKFQPGQSGNIAGRPIGSKNKVNEKLRDSITLFLNGSFEQIKGDFDSLKPYQRVRFWIELLNFSVPKLSSMAVTDEFEKLTDEQLDEVINQLKNHTSEETSDQAGED